MSWWIERGIVHAALESQTQALKAFANAQPWRLRFGNPGPLEALANAVSDTDSHTRRPNDASRQSRR